MSSHGSGRSGLLTAEALVRQFRSLTHSHAEEMTWSADWIGQAVCDAQEPLKSTRTCRRHANTRLGNWFPVVLGALLL
eukprot:3701414-Amphidinium_carterae.1